MLKRSSLKNKKAEELFKGTMDLIQSQQEIFQKQEE